MLSSLRTFLRYYLPATLKLLEARAKLEREVNAGGLLPGDVIQLGRGDGDFYHTLLVTGAEGDDFLVSAHTNDARNRPLSTYNYATARFLHVMGTRVQLANEECYRQLLEGVAFRPLRCSSDAPILPPPM